MFAILRPAVVLLVFFTVLTGLAYPLIVTGIAQVAMPTVANGSLLRKEGQVVGSSLIGQSFAIDRYFHGRPSATSAPDPKDATKTVDAPYNAASSVGSNLGPLSKKLIDRVDADVAVLQKSGAATVPADAVTASASGLDPHISPAFAAIQIERVARSRGVTTDRIRAILDQSIERPFLDLFGEPRVNVLVLNLTLDAALGGANG